MSENTCHFFTSQPKSNLRKRPRRRQCTRIHIFAILQQNQTLGCTLPRLRQTGEGYFLIFAVPVDTAAARQHTASSTCTRVHAHRDVQENRHVQTYHIWTTGVSCLGRNLSYAAQSCERTLMAYPYQPSCMQSRMLHASFQKITFRPIFTGPLIVP